MPLGGALVIGGATLASQAGGKKSAKDQQKLEQQRIAEANRIGEENHNSQLEYIQMLRDTFGGGGEMSGLLADPLHSSTNQSYQSSTTPTFNKQGKAALADMTQAAMNERARAESQPEFLGMAEGMARDYGQQMSGLKTALGNRAAARGAAPMDTDLEATLAGRGITGNFLAQKQQIPLLMEQSRMGKNNVANMLMGNIAQLTRGQNTRGSSSSQTEQDQGPGAMLNYYNMLRPPERTVYV